MRQTTPHLWWISTHRSWYCNKRILAIEMEFMPIVLCLYINRTLNRWAWPVGTRIDTNHEWGFGSLGIALRYCEQIPTTNVDLVCWALPWHCASRWLDQWIWFVGLCPGTVQKLMPTSILWIWIVTTLAIFQLPLNTYHQNWNGLIKGWEWWSQKKCPLDPIADWMLFHIWTEQNRTREHVGHTKNWMGLTSNHQMDLAYRRSRSDLGCKVSPRSAIPVPFYHFWSKWKWQTKCMCVLHQTCM